MAVGYGSSTSTGTNDALVTSINVPVPAGVAAGNHVYVALEQWEAANPTVTTPSGFVLVGQQVSGPQKLKVFVKEATGPDAGSYTFSWSGTQWTLGHAIRVTGAKAGNPTGANFNGASSASGTAIPNTSVTVGFIPGLLQWSCNENAATQTTPPTNFTEVQDSNYLHSNHRMNAATSGTFTAPNGVLSVSTLILAMLVAVEPAASGATVTGVAVAPLGALTVSAAGFQTEPGTAAAALGGLSATAVGGVTNAGTASAQFGSLTAAASGATTVPATAAAELGGLSAAAVGSRSTIGTANAALGGLEAAAAATVAVAATAAAPLGSLASTAAGTVSAPGGGTAAAPLGPLSSAASGSVTTAAVAAATLGALVATGAGTRATTAAATALLGGLVASATGARFTTGTAVALLGALAADAVVVPPATLGSMTATARVTAVMSTTERAAAGMSATARSMTTMGG